MKWKIHLCRERSAMLRKINGIQLVIWILCYLTPLPIRGKLLQAHETTLKNTSHSLSFIIRNLSRPIAPGFGRVWRHHLAFCLNKLNENSHRACRLGCRGYLRRMTGSTRKRVCLSSRLRGRITVRVCRKKTAVQTTLWSDWFAQQICLKRSFEKIIVVFWHRKLLKA